MTDHATGAQAATDRPEIEIGANGQSLNPRYVPLPDGSLFDIAESHGLTPGERPRCDGWTADRQRRFLVALSRGLTVDRACAIVEMSRTAAYSFRASARGAAFALGWEAAQIRARDILADELMDRARMEAAIRRCLPRLIGLYRERISPDARLPAGDTRIG